MRTIVDAAKEAGISAVIAAKEAGISAVIAADVAVMSYANKIGQEVTICIFIHLNHSRTICKVIIYCVATRIASVCQQDSLP